MKTAILITVRLKSTRLARKALLPMGGLPMLARQIRRLKRARSAERVILCTSVVPEDDDLITVAQDEGVPVFRGHPEDVFLRMTDAARQFGIDLVLNATGDNPYVDAECLDRLAAYHLAHGHDFTPVQGIPLGSYGWALSFPAMERVCQLKATEDTETWPEFFYNTDLFRWGFMDIQDPDLRWPELRLTVDNPEDYELVTRIYDELHRADPTDSFTLRDIVALCRRRPDLVAINAHIQQVPRKKVAVRSAGQSAAPRLTVVMYHYVRDLAHSRYPGIKGLETSRFRGQLGYLRRHYRLVAMEQVLDALDGKAELPERAALLTFDDGYADHFRQVFPILDELGIRGAFYPPVLAITRHRVLQPNKIHFILAANPDVAGLVKRVFGYLDQYRDEYHLDSNEHYYQTLAKPNRWDPAEVIFIKRLFQRELPRDLREKVLTPLLEQSVGAREDAFSRELYMSVDQIKTLIRHGMHVGAHGQDHDWLSALDPAAQAVEIDESVRFLRQVGADVANWTMCYPYGDYNAVTLNLLGNRGCKLGLTCVPEVASVTPEARLTMPRLDTNDLPCSADAPANAWCAKA